MATLRALAFSAFILSALAACATAPVPEQIAGDPQAVADLN